jgi:serine phosphatase RsbU (regulator of sigma subunit)
MSVRLRLIVVFFLLSVVPLGAVTYYTYRNNVQAVRDTAGLEAELLAGELSQSMSTVTTQLTQRVEQLIEVPALAAETPAVPPATPARPDPGAAAVAAESASQAEAAALAALERAQMSERLGAFADMVNNIEFVGGRRGSGRRGGFAGGDPRTSLNVPGGPGRAGLGPNGRNGVPAGPPPPQEFGERRGDPPVPGRGASAPRGDGTAASNGTVAEPEDPNRIRIDLGDVRREMFDSLVPDREAFEKMTPEQRREVFEQIDERMRGVSQGIAVLQKEIASRVAVDIRTQGATLPAEQALASATDPAPAAATPAATGRTSSAPTTVPPAPAPPTPPTPAPANPSAAASARRSMELSGNRLAVRVQRDGELVGEVNADVDLPKLLATVFDSTSRDRGELLFAVGQDGHLYTPDEAARERLLALGPAVTDSAAAPGTVVLDDWIVATTEDPTGSGLKFGIARPVGEALRDLRASAARNAGLGLGFIALAIVGIVPLSSRLTRNLESLSSGVSRLSRGDYSARVEVKSRDEIGRLAEAFNQMAADVERHQRSAVEQERIRRELELGRRIQHDMLPRTPLRAGLTEVKGISVPAREVGGDFFNYFQLSDGSIALVVGDVSGKGVGAALLMANIQAALRARLSLGQDLAALARELDVEIDRTTPGPVYATLFVGIFDPGQRMLRCVNAGHNPQYVLRSDRRLEKMESTGRPIGLFAGGGYEEQRLALDPGDVLFFYTDGCVEAENAAGDMYGPERLEHALTESAGKDADQVLVAMERDVTRFRAGVELQDDATMMVVRVG